MAAVFERQRAYSASSPVSKSIISNQTFESAFESERSPDFFRPLFESSGGEGGCFSPTADPSPAKAAGAGRAGIVSISKTINNRI